jgi:hypothetical protein
VFQALVVNDFLPLKGRGQGVHCQLVKSLKQRFYLFIRFKGSPNLFTGKIGSCPHNPVIVVAGPIC